MGGRAPWCPVSAPSRKEGLDSRFFSVPSAQAESRRLLLPLPPEAKAARPSPSCRWAPLQLWHGAHLGGGPRLRRCPAEGGVARGCPASSPFPGFRGRDCLRGDSSRVPAGHAWGSARRELVLRAGPALHPPGIFRGLSAMELPLPVLACGFASVPVCFRIWTSNCTQVLPPLLVFVCLVFWPFLLFYLFFLSFLPVPLSPGL